MNDILHDDARLETPIDLQAKLDVIGSALWRKAQQQIGSRQEIEQRWIEDLRQYNGRYTEETETRLAKDKAGTSRIFVNLTRPKCRALEARLSEMLFPSDDKNWAIQPTPSPELAATQSLDPALAAPVQALQQQAKAAADAMQRTIDDQLTETDYATRAKKTIHDAVVYGIGIIKGPVMTAKTDKVWQDQDGVQMLQVSKSTRPSVESVSPWDFFPDMSAATLEQAEFIFERRYISKKALRRLAQRPGYRADSIRAALQDGPRRAGQRDGRRQELRDITGIGQLFDETQYEWWEYHGPIEREDAEILGIDIPDDPLIGLEVMIELVGERVIRAELHPLDTQDLLYSVFILEPDESTVFGYGIPYILRSPQTAINAAWRMMLDNAALSVGPQIIINQGVIKPADGVYALSARKVWLLDGYERSVNEAFAAVNVNSTQPELMAIFETARQLIEMESNIPDLMQGELGDNPQQTASGISMAMNAANTVLRTLVKRWDDEVTKPLLRRFYDFNMQYSGDPAIKGDFEVDARGSSALMVKETQSQALMQLLQLAQSPVLAPLTKFPALYRKAIETLRLSPDELVKTDDELAAEQHNQQAAGPDPAMQMEAQGQQMQAQAQVQQTETDAQLKREEMAMQERMKAAELQSDAQDREVEWAKEQLKAQQVQTEERLKAVMGSGI
jgi:hypothetical protein